MVTDVVKEEGGMGEQLGSRRFAENAGVMCS